MTNRENREFDELNNLIDDIENDDTLERKMNDFTRRKERKNRMDRLRNEQSKSEPESFVVRQEPEPSVEHTIPAGNQDAGKTTAFDWKQMQEEVEPKASETVVIDDQKIQSLMEEEAAQTASSQSIQYVQKPIEEQVMPSNNGKKKNNRNTAKIVGIAVLIVLALVLGVFAFTTIRNSLSGDDTTEELQQANYEELMAWIEDYDTYTTDEKNDNTKYEDINNSLSSSQKAKVDAALKEKTGKTFDQLLARAKTAKKKSSSNNNRKNAESKASLRKQLSTLQDQLDQAQSDLEDIEDQISDVQSDLNTLATSIASKENEVTAAQAEASEAYQNYLNASDDEKSTYKSIYDTKNSEYNRLYNELSNLRTQQSTLNSNLTSLNTSKSSLQSTINDLNAQITDVNNQLSELD